MLLISGTIRVDPARIDQARPAMEAMVRASNAEDGCYIYAYAQDLLDPGLIHVIERWRDRDALKAHFTSPHMAEWRGVIPSLGITDRDLRLYEVASEEVV